MVARLIAAVAFIVIGAVVATPALMMAPFAVPGTCAASNICLWFGMLAFSAVSPLLIGMALLLAAALDASRRIILVLRWAVVATPAFGSGFVIWLIAMAAS